MIAISSASLKTRSFLPRTIAKLKSNHYSIVETYRQIFSSVGFRRIKGTNEQCLFITMLAPRWRPVE